VRSVGLSPSNEELDHLRNPMSPIRPLREMREPSDQFPEDTEQVWDAKHALRIACAPRLSCFVAIVFVICTGLATGVTIMALLPNQTTSTTTTTTTTTSRTTTTTTSSHTSTSTTKTTTTTTTTTSGTTTTTTAVTLKDTTKVSGPDQGGTTQLRAGTRAPSTQVAAPPQPVATTTVQTTTRSTLTSVCLSMKVRNLDYAGLIARPTLRTLFEAQIRGAIASEAGHGVLPDAIQLALSAGSVNVQATIVELQPDMALAVTKGLRSSKTLGPKLASSVNRVEGVEAISTGDISVTNLAAHSTGLPPPGAGGPSPVLIVFLIIGVVGAVAGLVVLGVFLWRRHRNRRKDGGLMASEDSRQPRRAEGEATPPAPDQARARARAAPGRGEPRSAGPSPPSRPMAKQPASKAASSSGPPVPKLNVPTRPSSGPSGARAPAGASMPVARTAGLPKRGDASRENTYPDTPGTSEANTPQTTPRGQVPAKAKAKVAAKALAKVPAKQRAASSVAKAPVARPSGAKAPGAKAPGAKAPGARPPAGGGGGPEPSASFLQTATDMGFSVQQARAALAEVGGDEDAAMDNLLTS